MRPNTYLSLSLITLVFSILNFAVTATESTKTSITCHTYYTKKKPPVVHSTTHVTTKPITLTVTHKTTHTLTTTVSTKPIIATQYSTVSKTLSTTLPQATSTFSTTSTYHSTIYFPKTSTSTVISTTTTYVATFTPTTTISPSPGFTPLAIALKEEGYTPSRKKKRLAKRDEVQSLMGAVPGKSLKQRSSKKYPASVSCIKYIEPVSTLTRNEVATQTKTVTAKPTTKFQTVTSSVTRTATVTPPAQSTTQTITTTQIAAVFTTVQTRTISTTSTVSATVTDTAATAYAVCGSNNMVSHINNYPIQYVGHDAYGIRFSVTAFSAYQCCQACLDTSDCAGAAWLPGVNTCDFALTGGVCSPGTVFGHFQIDTDPGSTQAFIVMNSNCGQWGYEPPT